MTELPAAMSPEAVSRRNRIDPPALKHALRTRLAEMPVFTSACRRDFCLLDFDHCPVRPARGEICVELENRKEKFYDDIIEIAPWIQQSETLLVRLLLSKTIEWTYIMLLINNAGGVVAAIASRPKTALGIIYEKLQAVERRVESLSAKLGLDPATRAKLGLAEMVGRSLAEQLRAGEPRPDWVPVRIDPPADGTDPPLWFETDKGNE